MERTIRMLSVEEASKSLGISPSETWHHIMEGKLTAIKIGGCCLVSELGLIFFKSAL